MIPVRLELTNFLAYRQPAPLDFTGIHVAVLCGENGAGKSSLLDALTWALWGRARAKTDIELVHQGQTEMRVEFTFLLGEQLYRVVRARKVGKGAQSLLDFQAAGPDGQLVSIGEATIPKTQEKINKILRLTFETFTNSAYLVQGQADEFTGKRATERKQVLADILGLAEWDDYEARAKKKIQAIDLRLAGLESVLREIENELARRPDYERELREFQARVIEVAERLRQAEAGWAKIDAARQAMIALERQLTDLERRIRDSEKEIGILEADLREALLRADADKLHHELELHRRTLADLEQQDQEHQNTTQARQLVVELAASLRGQNESARAEADALKKRLETLAAATEPRCPTCGQPLAEPERAALVLRLDAEVEARRSQYRENQANLKKLGDEQTAFDRQLSATANNLRGKGALIKRVAELEAATAGAGEARARAAALSERREGWAVRLKQDREQAAALEAEAEQHNRVLRDSAARQRALDQLRQEDTLTKGRLGAAQQ